MRKQAKSRYRYVIQKVVRQLILHVVFFLVLVYRSKSPAHLARWKQIQDEVETNGAYHLTETELIYGAKMAWRNSSRCIGRIQWSKLQVSEWNGDWILNDSVG